MYTRFWLVAAVTVCRKQLWHLFLLPLQYSFESLFRSMHFALLDNSCREYLFLADFFMAHNNAAKDLFTSVFGKTLSLFLVGIVGFTTRKSLNCVFILLRPIVKLLTRTMLFFGINRNKWIHTWKPVLTLLGFSCAFISFTDTEYWCIKEVYQHWTSKMLPWLEDNICSDINNGCSFIRFFVHSFVPSFVPFLCSFMWFIVLSFLSSFFSFSYFIRSFLAHSFFVRSCVFYSRVLVLLSTSISATLVSSFLPPFVNVFLS